MTAKALWPQDPIQEPLTSSCSEDTNGKAVAGFNGEWLRAALVPTCAVALGLGTWLLSRFALSLDLLMCRLRKSALPAWVSIRGLCGIWGSRLTLAPLGFPWVYFLLDQVRHLSSLVHLEGG